MSCCPLCGNSYASDEVILLPARHMVCRGNLKVYLTVKEWELFSRLHAVAPRVLSHEALLDWLYQLESGDEPGIKIVSVFVFKIRRKVKPLGIKIISAFAFGYGLEIDGASRVVTEAEAA